MVTISIDVLVGIILGLLFVVFLFIPSFWLFRRIQEQSKKSIWKKIVDAVLLPFNFGAIFLEQRKIEHLPFYYRWFLQFTEYTSRIQYFHFLPKAIIAFSAEWLIQAFTGEDVLTAIIFSWSIIFLILITWVESRSGEEMHSETVVFANKLFLYTVSMLGLFLVLSHSFFWDSIRGTFETPFWEFMASIAHGFNHFLWQAWLFFWNLPVLLKFGILFIILIYIFSFTSFSKKEDDEKSEKQ